MLLCEPLGDVNEACGDTASGVPRATDPGPGEIELDDGFEGLKGLDV